MIRGYGETQKNTPRSRGVAGKLGSVSPCHAFSLIALCGLMLAMLSGCATTADIDNLQKNVDVQRVQLDQLKANVDTMSHDIGYIKEQGVGAIKESQSSLLSQVSDLSKAVQVLEGRFDENKYNVDKTEKDLLAEKDLQQARIASLENELKELKAKLSQEAQPSAAPETAPETGSTPAAGQKTPAATDYSVPQKLYDDAQIDFKNKHYPEARQKFEKFTTDFPKHTLAPNAWFWIGETYYAQKKYDDAILAYETFMKKYPSHDKVKAALLKQGYAFIENGDKKTGKVILERLIEKYPQSEEAKLAQKKIAEMLNHGGGATKKKKKKKSAS